MTCLSICQDCREPIPQARIDAVPDTKYCVKCVDKHIPQTLCRIIYSHKADCDLFIAKGKEQCRLLENEYRRKR